MLYVSLHLPDFSTEEVDVIKPIPKKLLIHTVTRLERATDRWGEETLKEKEIIKRVRIEPSNKVVRDKNNAEIQISATLFYDCKNSLPRDIQFSEDDIIVFNGQKHKVQTIEPLYDGERLHHIEMGLVKHA